MVQVVHSDVYKENANRQYATPSSDIYERGTIFFTKKNGELVRGATQTAGYKVAINPMQIKNANLTYGTLSPYLKIDKQTFIKRATKENDPYEEVATRLTKQQADQISDFSLSGVSVFKEKWRFYPGGSMASQSLGFVAFKGNELSGRYGLENYYDDLLSRDESNPYVNFFAEVFSNISDTISGSGKSGDIVTTIEPDVQDFLEKKLSSVFSLRSPDSLGGIIMNPKDGSIYALSSKPDFNPNNFNKVEDVSVFSNPLVSSIFEFGSVVKPLVMASAINEGVVTAETSYEDKGFVLVENKAIWNFDKKARGKNTTMQDVLSQSLNTGMVFVYNELGKDSMKDYLYSFGIKDKTKIDLPGESGSLTSNLESPRDIELANASFGQGIALTPMQMTRALASLSNGGYLVTPHLVKEVKYEDGGGKEITYKTEQTKIDQATSEEVSRMLVVALDGSLKTLGKEKLEHFSIAAKTGTAQVANPDGGGYLEDQHLHSFFGYFPAYDPEFLVFLYAVDPKGVKYASGTWTDPFLDIAKFLLNYYEIAPDR